LFRFDSLKESGVFDSETFVVSLEREQAFVVLEKLLQSQGFLSAIEQHDEKNSYGQDDRNQWREGADLSEAPPSAQPEAPKALGVFIRLPNKCESAQNTPYGNDSFSQYA
jgi:hypothetical protein